MSAAEAAKQAARLTDPVEHGLGMLGIIGGLVLGAVVGALLVAATVATGGGALAIAIAAVGAVGATAGGGLAGGQLVRGLASLMGCSGITTGAIGPKTSPNVRANQLFSARTEADGASCSGLLSHFSNPMALIAEGSATVRINGYLAARLGDKLVCGGKVRSGSENVMIGGPTQQVLEIHDNEELLTRILQGVALASLVGVLVLMTGGVAAGALCGMVLVKTVAVGLLFFGVNELLGQLPGPWADIAQGALGIGGLVVGGFKALRSIGTGRPWLKDPVDGVTGEVCTVKTDIMLPGALSLVLTRAYSSGIQHGSCFGPGWQSTWGQWVEDFGSEAVLHTADGRAIDFEVLGATWSRHQFVNRIQLRRALAGFEVRNDDGCTLLLAKRQGSRWLLTQIADTNGNTIQFDHDEAGAIRRVIHTGGYRLDVDSTPSQIRRVTLIGEGGSRTELIRYEYDEAGRLSAVIDGSKQPFRYWYDSENRITRWHDREGTWYQYTYDSQGRCVAVEGAEGMYAARFQYDVAPKTNQVEDSNGVTILTYNDYLQVVRQVDPRKGVTTTVWDERSNKLEETDPEGRTSSYTYDVDGNVLSVTDPMGRTTRIEYDADGHPIRLIDPALRAWIRRYDDRGNLIASGLEGAKPWRYQRDQAGNVARLIDPLGNERSLVHNGVGLPIWLTDWQGNPTRLGRDDHGRIVWDVNPLGGQTLYEYGSLSKLTAMQLSTGDRYRWKYDNEGNVIARTTAKGQEYTYSYGAFNVLTGIQRPSGRQLELRYNSDGRLVEVENEAHETYRYEYNATGQVIGEEDFSGRRLGYDFDLSGFCIKRVNGLGEVIEISRDACGRVIRKLASDGEETTFEYDVYGRFTKAVNASSEVVFERDEFGRILKEIQNGRGVESEYDERGLRIRRRTAYGPDLGLSYDANGLLIAVEAGGAEMLRFSRDVMGRETERHSRVGFSLLQQYDPVHRLIGQWVGSAGVGVVERRYKYDGNDNPVEIDDSSWGRSRFEFDEDDRVNAARHEKGGDEQFTYEPTGNVAASLRLTFGRPPRGDAKIGWQTHFYSKGGRLEQLGDTRYFYDADNRIVEKHDAADRWRYQWSAEGRLVSVRRPDGEVWRYSYDAFGRRFRKQGPRGATNYLWDERVVAEKTVEGEAPVSWVFEPESFRPLLKQQAGQAYPCVTDHGGAPRELMTTDGRVAWSARLSVWGYAEESVSRTDCHLRFQGQWSDEESGLYYNWVRYYDPDSEVYISPDPIGFNGGPRLHGYVDNPLTWVDPMGLTGDPATATHITYVGIKDGLPYVGYASMPGDKTGLEVLNYRYSNNFDAFETEPRVVYRGYGMEGKQTARGLEQRIFDDYGGLGKTANRQNPVGPGNANRDTYLAKADAYRAANAADEGVNPRVNRAVNRTC